MVPSNSAGELSRRRTSTAPESMRPASRVLRKTQSLQTTQGSSTEDIPDWAWNVSVGVCKAGFSLLKFGLIICDKAISKTAHAISDKLDDVAEVVTDSLFSEKPKQD